MVRFDESYSVIDRSKIVENVLPHRVWVALKVVGDKDELQGFIDELPLAMSLDNVNGGNHNPVVRYFLRDGVLYLVAQVVKYDSEFVEVERFEGGDEIPALLIHSYQTDSRDNPKTSAMNPLSPDGTPFYLEEIIGIDDYEIPSKPEDIPTRIFNDDHDTI